LAVKTSLILGSSIEEHNMQPASEIRRRHLPPVMPMTWPVSATGRTISRVTGAPTAHRCGHASTESSCLGHRDQIVPHCRAV